MVKRRALPLLLALAACDTGWKPASVIDSLRVIGVRAEPPEVRPGQTAVLSTLLLDPTRPGKKSTVLWLGCDPDPFDLNRGSCTDLSVLQDTASFADARSLPPGVRIIGFDGQAAYTAPANTFDALPADAEQRTSGTAGLVIELALGADVAPTANPDELTAVLQKVQTKEIASQLTLFRVRISESPAPNQNPVIDDLIVAGETIPRGATVPLNAFIEHPLDVTAHDFEQYDETTPANGVERKTERIIVAWYSTTGRFDHDRVAIGSDVKAKLQGPGDVARGNDPIPEDRRGTLWAVARDSRGGQSWRAWPWWLCDSSAPAPRVTSVDRGTQLVLRGENLDQVLDVISDAGAVRGAYSAATQTWSGEATAGPLRLRAKSCVTLPLP